MKRTIVQLPLIAEVTVEHSFDEDPKEMARIRLDKFREAVMPSENYGIFLYQADGETLL